MEKTHQIKGAFFSLLATLLMSLFPLFFNDLGEMVSTQTAVMLLFTVSFMVTLPLALATRSLFVPLRGMVWIALVALTAYVGNSAYSLALHQIEPAIASSIKQTELIFVAILGAIFLKEHLTYPMVLCIGISMLGVIILQGDLAQLKMNHLNGSLLMILTSFCFALMLLFSKMALRFTHAVSINFYRLLFLVAVGSLHLWQEVITLPPTVWIITLACALSGPVGARFAMTHALNYISMTRMMTYTLLAPVLTAFWQWIAWGLGLSLSEWLGTILVVLGTSLMFLRRNQTPISARLSKSDTASD